METVKLKSHVGADGILKLEVPTSMRDSDLDVVLVIQPSNRVTDVTDVPSKRVWPPDFFDKTAGAWQGEPLVREPQGEYDIRDSLK